MTLQKIANFHSFTVNLKNCQNFEKSYHSFQTTKLEKKNTTTTLKGNIENQFHWGKLLKK